MDKITKTFDGPGKGRKQCVHCKQYTGVRTLVCICGKPFLSSASAKTTATAPAQSSSSSAKKSAIPQVVKTVSMVFGAILIPAGPCPVQLTGTDEETIRIWRNELKQHYSKKGEELADSGVQYFVRHFYDMRSDDYRKVTGVLVNEQTQQEKLAKSVS